MTATTTTIEQPAGGGLTWYALSAQDVTAQMGVDADTGLTVAEVERRQAEYGPNELPAEPPPSMWVVARAQLVNPMNIMLLIVVAASFAIVQIATAVVVLGLVTFNVVMGTAQELKARASVEALAKLQVPHARVQRSKSPLQRELDGMTKVFGGIAFIAVAIIAIFGLVRGQDTTTLVLLCISTAIAAIPTGLPTFVQAMLSSGAQRLAEAKAVVKSLSDVETLGGTTLINSDKTGTLTLNAMTATTMLAGGDWFKIEGPGYQKSGAILGVAG